MDRLLLNSIFDFALNLWLHEARRKLHRSAAVTPQEREKVHKLQLNFALFLFFWCAPLRAANLVDECHPAVVALLIHVH